MSNVLYQSKKCEQGGSLPHPAVDLAKKSVKTFQSLLGRSSYWEIRYVTSLMQCTYSLRTLLAPALSLVLLHQLIPFFILCLDILGNPVCKYLDEDLMLVTWVYDYVEVIVQGRIELRPIAIAMKGMVTACYQTKVDLLARPSAGFGEWKRQYFSS